MTDKEHLDHQDELRDLMSGYTREDPGADFWNRYHDRLSERMDAENSLQKSLDRGLFPWSAWDGVTALVRRPAFQLAFAVCVLFTGILIGRYGLATQNDIVPETGLMAEEVPDSEPAVPRSTGPAIERAHAIVDRAKTLLLGMAHYDPDTDNIATLGLEKRRGIAERLGQEAMLVAEELGGADEQQLNLLLSELEEILGRIAKLEPDLDGGELEMIVDTVNRQSLLFKIEISELRRADA